MSLVSDQRLLQSRVSRANNPTGGGGGGGGGGSLDPFGKRTPVHSWEYYIHVHKGGRNYFQLPDVRSPAVAVLEQT